MSKKQWFYIQAECITDNAALTIKKGDITILAKVKSQGLAFVVANTLAKTMSKDFYVTIK